MTTFTSPQPPFTVTTESERNTEWPDGTRVYCKDTNKSYVLDDHTFVLIGGGSSAGGAAWGQIAGTLSAQTDLQGALNGKASSSHNNSAHSETYITSASAVIPNVAITGATKTKITYDAKGLITSGVDATTADIADSADKRYCTDAQKTIIANTSGSNTGDASGHSLLAPLASPSLTTPNIGAATGTSLAVTGAITSSGGGIGYAVGSGSSVTQGTNRTTGVTLNKLCGNITMFSGSQAAAAVVAFTLTNSFIAATDIVIVQHISATNAGCWEFSNVPAAGSVSINVKNISAATITSATPLRFAIIKAVIT
jgi:hypothetical protein